MAAVAVLFQPFPIERNPAMATRWQLIAVALCMLQARSSGNADIYRWDTGEVIPGTEGKGIH